ncbi:MAG: hypothetical protein ACI9TH_001541 [Kiritimatiellia bacterium]|jgi:hypothetical protein
MSISHVVSTILVAVGMFSSVAVGEDIQAVVSELAALEQELVRVKAAEDQVMRSLAGRQKDQISDPQAERRDRQQLLTLRKRRAVIEASIKDLKKKIPPLAGAVGEPKEKNRQHSTLQVTKPLQTTAPQAGGGQSLSHRDRLLEILQKTQTRQQAIEKEVGRLSELGRPAHEEIQKLETEHAQLEVFAKDLEKTQSEIDALVERAEGMRTTKTNEAAPGKHSFKTTSQNSDSGKQARQNALEEQLEANNRSLRISRALDGKLERDIKAMKARGTAGTVQVEEKTKELAQVRGLLAEQSKMRLQLEHEIAKQSDIENSQEAGDTQTEQKVNVAKAKSLESTRKNLRITRATIRKIEEDMDSLQNGGEVPSLVLRDFIRQLMRLRELARTQEEMVKNVEDVAEGEPSIVEDEHTSTTDRKPAEAREAGESAEVAGEARMAQDPSEHGVTNSEVPGESPPSIESEREEEATGGPASRPSSPQEGAPEEYSSGDEALGTGASTEHVGGAQKPAKEPSEREGDGRSSLIEMARKNKQITQATERKVERDIEDVQTEGEEAVVELEQLTVQLAHIRGILAEQTRQVEELEHRMPPKIEHEEVKLSRVREEGEEAAEVAVKTADIKAEREEAEKNLRVSRAAENEIETQIQKAQEEGQSQASTAGSLSRQLARIRDLILMQNKSMERGEQASKGSNPESKSSPPKSTREKQGNEPGASEGRKIEAASIENQARNGADDENGGVFQPGRSTEDAGDSAGEMSKSTGDSSERVTSTPDSDSGSQQGGREGKDASRYNSKSAGSTGRVVTVGSPQTGSTQASPVPGGVNNSGPSAVITRAGGRPGGKKAPDAQRGARATGPIPGDQKAVPAAGSAEGEQEESAAGAGGGERSPGLSSPSSRLSGGAELGQRKEGGVQTGTPEGSQGSGLSEEGVRATAGPGAQVSIKGARAGSVGRQPEQSEFKVESSGSSNGDQSEESQGGEPNIASLAKSLDDARRYLELSEKTRDEVAQTVENVKRREGSGQHELVEQYQIYFTAIASMTALHRETVNKMEPAYAKAKEDLTTKKRGSGGVKPDLSHEGAEVAKLEDELDSSPAGFGEGMNATTGAAAAEMEQAKHSTFTDRLELARKAAGAAKRIKAMGIDVGTGLPGQTSESSERDAGVTAENAIPIGEPQNEVNGGHVVSGPLADDDIVSRQMRELAEKERDPVKREAYWKEYRNYKGGQ